MELSFKEMMQLHTQEEQALRAKHLGEERILKRDQDAMRASVGHSVALEAKQREQKQDLIERQAQERAELLKRHGVTAERWKQKDDKRQKEIEVTKKLEKIGKSALAEGDRLHNDFFQKQKEQRDKDYQKIVKEVQKEVAEEKKMKLEKVREQFERIKRTLEKSKEKGKEK